MLTSVLSLATLAGVLWLKSGWPLAADILRRPWVPPGEVPDYPRCVFSGVQTPVLLLSHTC